MDSTGDDAAHGRGLSLGNEAWQTAVRLIAQITVGIGLLLVALGAIKASMVYLDSHRGLETLATIEASALHGIGQSLRGGGSLDLSWQDVAGDTRRAAGITVSQPLGRKLRIGGALSRSQLRIRYRPESPALPIVVIEDVPLRVRAAAGISVAGFMAMSVGSLMMLGLLLLAQVRQASHSASHTE